MLKLIISIIILFLIILLFNHKNYKNIIYFPIILGSGYLLYSIISHHKYNSGGNHKEIGHINHKDLGNIDVYLINKENKIDDKFYIKLLENSKKIESKMLIQGDNESDTESDIEIIETSEMSPEQILNDELKKFSPLSYYHGNKDENLLLFVYNEEIISFIVYEIRNDENGNHIFIQQIIVNPKYRGKGLCPLSIKYLISYTNYEKYRLVNMAIPYEAGKKCYIDTFRNSGYNFIEQESNTYMFTKNI